MTATASVVSRPAERSHAAFLKAVFESRSCCGTQLERIGGDELLYPTPLPRRAISVPGDGRIDEGLRLKGELIDQETQSPLLVPDAAALLPALTLQTADASASASGGATSGRVRPMVRAERAGALPSPRADWNNIQAAGGGHAMFVRVRIAVRARALQAIREVLRRVMAAQNADGDWPQWFMFFERERLIRAGDSHGDIALWPLETLAQYLIATGDAALLEEQVRFFDARGPEKACLFPSGSMHAAPWHSAAAA